MLFLLLAELACPYTDYNTTCNSSLPLKGSMVSVPSLKGCL